MYTGTFLGIESRYSVEAGKSTKYSTPSEVQYELPTVPVRMTRKIVKRPVDTTMPVTNQNPLIRWRIPSNGQVILDFRRAKIYLTISAAVDAPWSVRFAALIWNIIERWRLEQGGQYVEDRRFFGHQETLVYTVQTHINQQVTTGVALYGDGSQARRNTRAAGWKYVLPFPTTALTKTIYPWYQVRSTGNGVGSVVALPDTYCQWEFAKPEDCLEVYGGVGPITGLSYEITSMEIEYEELYPEGGSKVLLSNWLPSTPFAVKMGYPSIWYRTFLTNVYPLSQNTEQNIYMDFKLSSIMSIFATFFHGDTVSDPTVWSKHTEYISQIELPLIEYQWEINSSLWPDKPVNLIDPGWVEGYAKYLESWSMFHSRTIHQEVTPITIDQFLTDKFVLAFDGNMYPFSQNLLSPISTANSGSITQLRLKFSAPPPANIQIRSHVYHWRRWNFGSNGQIPIVDS